MAISKKKLSYHLTKFQPEIVKLVKRKKRKFFFGLNHDRTGTDDLVQEVMLDLWMRVPEGYEKDKGELKSYCMTIADRFLSRVGYRSFKEHRKVELAIDEDELNPKNAFQSRVLDTLAVPSKRNEILIKVKLQDLAKEHKDFKVIKVLHACDGNRSLAKKRLGISKPYITKICNRLKKGGLLKEDNLVNVFNLRSIVNI